MSDITVELPTNYKAEDYMKLKADERRSFDNFMQSQISYNQSLTDVFKNQANSFQEEKEKISYERADPKYIPFLAYCWRVAATAVGGSVVLLGGIFKLSSVEEPQLKIFAVIILCITLVMILGLLVPLRLLPKKIDSKVE